MDQPRKCFCLLCICDSDSRELVRAEAAAVSLRRNRDRTINRRIFRAVERIAIDGGAVCTENSVRVDYVTESPNVSDDDRSVLLLPDPVRLAVQVEEPT